MYSAKVIVPKTVLNNPQALTRAVENALSGAALDVKVDFEVTTQTWDERPPFTIASEPGKRTIGTTDAVYQYVDAGTRPHTIAPINAKALAFPANYAAKTTPHVIASQPGGKSGKMVFRQEVHHPGSKAREFSQTIGEKWKAELPAILQRSIDAEVARQQA